jgi:hypothetical protein
MKVEEQVEQMVSEQAEETRRVAVDSPAATSNGESAAQRSRLLNARDATEYLGVSLSTLNRIEKRGMLVPFRTPGGHRRYALTMLDEYLENTRKLPGQSDGAQSGAELNTDG